MDIWSLPIAAVVVVLLLVSLMRVASVRVSDLTYELAEKLSEKKVIGSSNRGLVRRQLTPGWVNGVGWSATFLNLLLFVYVGMRFGWLWAVGYAVASHLFESLPLPLPPTSRQTRAIVLAQAEKNAPKLLEKLEF